MNLSMKDLMEEQVKRGIEQFGRLHAVLEKYPELRSTATAWLELPLRDHSELVIRYIEALGKVMDLQRSKP